MADADELVRRYILRSYRDQAPGSHLATCPEVVVEEAETRHALFYDTGVDGVIFEATLRCPHESKEYEYGELGDLSDILADMERDDANEERP